MKTELYMDGSLLSQGNAELFYPQEHVRSIRWEDKDHLYQFILGPESVEILSQQDVTVTLGFSHEKGEAAVVSEHGEKVLPAELIRYEQRKDAAEVIYRLQGETRSFQLNWKEEE